MMNNVKKIIISFFAGIIVSSIAWAGFIYSSINRDTKYEKLYQQLRNTNQHLTESIRDRQATIRGLQTINQQLRNTNQHLTESIRDRQATISDARKNIEGARTSLERLEQIIKLLQKLDQDSNPNISD